MEMKNTRSRSIRFTLSGGSHLVSSFECNCFGSFFCLIHIYIDSIIRIVLYFVTFCYFLFPCLLRDRAPSARLFLLGPFFGPFDGPLFVSSFGEHRFIFFYFYFCDFFSFHGFFCLFALLCIDNNNNNNNNHTAATPTMLARMG
jgi:hypothetical protein